MNSAAHRLDEGDAPFREAEAVQVGAQPVARPRDDEVDIGGVELVDEIDDHVGGGRVEPRDRGGIENHLPDRGIDPTASLLTALRR